MDLSGMHSDEDTPRLAEIARTLADFRAEFRTAVSDMVRKDVYSANMAAMQLQIDSVTRENARLASEIHQDRSDKKAVKNLALGAGFTGVVAFGIGLIQLVLK